MGAQSLFLLFGKIVWSPVLGLLFTGTLSLYALHRLIGISRMRTFENIGRYQVIARYRHHILAYGILGGIGALYFILQLDRSVLIAFLYPAVISLGYILPLPSGKRLRDYHYLKIFLISFCWALLTAWLPAMEKGLGQQLSTILQLAERALFIFAITIPFDIRDLDLDSSDKVHTLPGRWGLQRSKRWAITGLVMAGLIGGIQWWLGLYALGSFLALLFSSGLSGCLIWYSTKDLHDYYFSGLLDGMMLVQAGLVIATGFF